MGILSNIFSDGNTLLIVTDHTSVCAGGVVTGRVHALFKKPPPPSTRIMLEFYGDEVTRCKWTETTYHESTAVTGEEDNSGTTTTTYNASSTHPMVSIEWVLAELSELTPGCYVYPFSFTLPADLSSSLCENGHSGPPACLLHYGLRTGLVEDKVRA